MLFWLRYTNGDYQYLIKNKQYIVGRKDCDIIINNDSSISRIHASLIARADKVILCDLGSKYNTFKDSLKIEPNNEVTLYTGSTIKFGALNSIFRLEGTNIVATTSNLGAETKRCLLNRLNTLGGTLISNWNSGITHVTVDQIKLSAKVLCAIITGIPLVTPKYWDDYAANVEQNLPPPNFLDYKPPFSELLVNHQNVSIEFNEKRLTLFNNKVFVFPIQNEMNKIIDMIKLAGGDAISLSNECLTKEMISKSSKDYIILCMDAGVADKNEIVTYIEGLNQRTIPLQEVALAILNCSCEKDCNPKFDRKGTVLAVVTQMDVVETMDVLAMATQTPAELGNDYIKTEVIPHTLDAVTSSDSQPILNDIKVDIEETVIDRGNVKREWSFIEDSIATKKRKIEPVFTKSRLQKRQESESRENSNPQPQQLFAFNQQSVTKENRSEFDNTDTNIFSKKRRTREETNATPAKKSKSYINPLHQISRSNNTQSITAHSLHDENTIKGSVIKIEDYLENSTGWISKSTSTKSPTNDTTKDMEDDIREYIESFRNTVVIEKKNLVVRSSNNNDYTITEDGQKNFKKFQKVPPLRMQTEIFPETKYTVVYFNASAVN